MKRLLKRLGIVAVTVIVFVTAAFTVSAQETSQATILFTHDLHSHLLPSIDKEGGEYGGYARLMTVINEQKAVAPQAVLVDAGDFAMGSLFQTAYATSAIELRMMGAMGYDATTLGNHEFDYLPQGLAAMLNSAKNSGDPLPFIVTANYKPDPDTTLIDPAVYQQALDNYGVKDYIILEKGDICYVIFGINGVVSDSYAPNSGMLLLDAAETAQKTVDAAVAQCRKEYGKEPVVICLSHAGTSKGEGEDYELAQKVNGIDVIVSGHTHTLIKEPIVVNDTYIVSAGEYGKYLGAVTLEYTEDGVTGLTDYQLIPVDETVEDDKEIAALVEHYKETVEKDYLSEYGVRFDEFILNNPYTFDTVSQLYDIQHESTLGNLFSDAYKWAAEGVTGEEIDLAVTASGVIRETLPVGDVSVYDIFNAASLGVGTEGELVKVYLTGKELKTVMEIDASVQPIMDNAQLFCSGAEYSFNTNRMIFNKVDYAMLRKFDGSLEEIKDDELYCVVTGMYCGEMLGSVQDISYGIISIIPKDKDGNPIDMSRLADYVIKDSDGTPLKEWYAITSYMQQMGGTMDSSYEQPDGRKVVYQSLNPVKLLKNANVFTFVLLAVVAVIVLIVFIIVRFVRRRIKRKK